MSDVIAQMLKGYNVKNMYDQKNAMKEIMQEIVLCGLSRAGFFKKAAFYGGTALRIFYGLDRFSEDLDFSLEVPAADFDLASYFPMLEKEVRSFGLNVTIMEKEKTKEHLLLFYADQGAAEAVAKGETVKIKFEVDVNPPDYASFEHKYRLLPVPYEVNLYDLPSLFAGKIHAVLCRAWKSRIKGRDLYDYVFYRSRRAAVNQKHLRARLIQSGFISSDAACTLDEIKGMLAERFDAIDYSQAKRDVEPFIHDTSVLNLWSADFFKQITEGLTVC